jgi:phage tail-like protein
MSDPGSRNDPLPVFCFKVDLHLASGGTASAFFKSVSGLAYETEAVELKVGGLNDSTWKLVGQTKWKNLIFKRGFTADSDLLTWRQGWMDRSAMSRVDGTIMQLDSTMKQTLATWTFKKGWPCKWELSEMDASKSELAIETLEIAHHGLKKT